MQLVSSTKALIQDMREDGWDGFLENVKSFCERYDIDIVDMSAR